MMMNNLETVTFCRTQFNLKLPSTVSKEISDAFACKYKSCKNVFVQLYTKRMFMISVCLFVSLHYLVAIIYIYKQKHHLFLSEQC